MKWLLQLLLVVAVGIGDASAGEFRKYVVASVSPAATDAGTAVLRGGGNAVDAAVAVALTLGVVDGNNSGIGGGCLMLLRTSKGEIVALDGREKAPAQAIRDMFVKEGKVQSQLAQTGALAIGVPGSLAVYDYVLKKYGRRSLRQVIAPAADLAERGFRVGPDYAKLLQTVSNDLVQFSASRAVFFPEGKLLKEGDLLRQPDLARSYRAIAKEGVRWFYGGAFARKTEAWMRENGGLLARKDFQSYGIVLREPLVSSYRNLEIVGFPPPSSGGVAVAEALNILEQFDLGSMGPVRQYHLLAEAMKFAFADRAHWLGDSDFAHVPRGLLDKAYARSLAGRIVLEHASSVEGHGTPAGWETNLFGKHTTHFSVADAEGNWVSCTTTVNTSFGSKVIIPGTGVIMNNQMDDFSSQPGVTNYFGLIGSSANAVAPGKRPLSSMSPTILLRDGVPVAALGAAGGPTIISKVLQQILWMTDGKMSAGEALQKPRLHHQWFPDELVVENRVSSEIREALAGLGHKVREVQRLGALQIVARAADGGFVGFTDPRGEGKAGGE